MPRASSSPAPGICPTRPKLDLPHGATAAEADPRLRPADTDPGRWHGACAERSTGAQTAGCSLAITSFTKELDMMVRLVTLLALLSALLVGRAQAQCMSDCDGNGAVAINELISCVSAALDASMLGQCTACDGSGDAKVAINELITGVNIALGA